MFIVGLSCLIIPLRHSRTCGFLKLSVWLGGLVYFSPCLLIDTATE